MIEIKNQCNGTSQILPEKTSAILELNGDDDMSCDGGNVAPKTIQVVPRVNLFVELWTHKRMGTKKSKNESQPVFRYAPLIRLKQDADIVSMSGTKRETKMLFK